MPVASESRPVPRDERCASPSGIAPPARPITLRTLPATSTWCFAPAEEPPNSLDEGLPGILAHAADCFPKLRGLVVPGEGLIKSSFVESVCGNHVVRPFLVGRW